MIDSNHVDSVDTKGQTLIPPSLSDFADTFASDLKSVLGIRLPVINDSSTGTNSIFLTLGNTDDYEDAAGRMTSEGYSLQVSSSGITIKGASALGVWWGTRTVLQQGVLRNGSIPHGNGIDSPGWGTRGAMLDAARHYYPPEFIIEMCSYLSFFKQNVFHLHLSDNLYNNVDIYTRERSLDLYAAFRPNSPNPAVAGLNHRANESYYRTDLDNIQQSCARRGVTIIPEIEAPGHALVITQWKPELALANDLSLLNISYPETIPTMETIWNVFLEWFYTKTVHIGADEYTGPESEYTKFVNAMSSYITGVSNKTIRIWGTFPPNSTSGASNVHKNGISIQHWEFFEANPYFDYIRNGYSVLNSDDAFYIVNKYSGSYPQALNISRIFNGNPAGGSYAPNIFDTKNVTNNPPRSSPAVIGHIAALWNDYGPNATSYLEAYYAWRDGLPALADKQWGGNLKMEQYTSLFPRLQPHIPAQNLDRRIRSKTPTILHYDFTTKPLSPSNNIPDLSGNGYNGTLSPSCLQTTIYSQGLIHLTPNCTLTTPLSSKGRNYTFTLTLTPLSHTPTPLLRGTDSSLWLGYGSSTNVTFETGGNLYALNYTLQERKMSEIYVVGKGNAKFLRVNGKEMQFLTKVGINGESFVWREIGIEAPVARIGGGAFEGLIKEVRLVDGA